jgi:hypothetical protein
MGLVYLTNGSMLFMASAFYLLILFSNKINNIWNVVYLGLYINIVILLLAILYTEGHVSYLGGSDFFYFYNKVLFLEAIFWFVFIYAYSYLNRNNSSLNIKDKIFFKSDLNKILYLVAISLFLIEIVISHEAYFASYADMPNAGTLVFEASCLLLAFIILKRGCFKIGSHLWLFELVSLGLALFIVLSTGKRLPFSYIIVAYIARILADHRYLRASFIYFCIAISAYFFGIFRDFFTFKSFDFTLIKDGLYATNQGAILHASAVYLRIVDENLVNIFDRIISFIGNFFGTLIFPISLLPEQVQINIFSMQHYPVQGNGGFIGSYSYYFLDWLGPVILGAFLAWFCSLRGKHIEVIISLIILTSPRWTLYNIGPVLRLIVMVSFLIFISHFIYKVILLNRYHHS